MPQPLTLSKHGTRNDETPERTCLSDCLKECEDLSKTRDFFVVEFFCLFVYLLFYNHFICTDCNVQSSDSKYLVRCGERSCFLSAYLLSAFVTYVCVFLNVSVTVFYMWPWLSVLTGYTSTYLNEVSGAEQLDVAANAVPARFDTLWYLKGSTKPSN